MLAETYKRVHVVKHAILIAYCDHRHEYCKQLLIVAVMLVLLWMLRYGCAKLDAILLSAVEDTMQIGVAVQSSRSTSMT